MKGTRYFPFFIPIMASIFLLILPPLIFAATRNEPYGVMPMADGAVETIVPDGAGGFYIGGSFTSLTLSSINGGGTVSRNRIARINSDGTVHPCNPDADWTVFTLAVNGGTVYAGGGFGSMGGQPRNFIAAFDAETGTLTDWNPNSNDVVRTTAVSGSTVYAGGVFSDIGGEPRNGIAAIDAATGISTSWNPDANGEVKTILIDGGTVYAGGEFTTIGGETRNHIAAIDAATGFPLTWNGNADGSVDALLLDGGTLYAGGGFFNIDGQSRLFLAALEAATGVVTTWLPPDLNSGVSSLAQDGGILIVGGAFSAVGTETRNHVAALEIASAQATAWAPDITDGCGDIVNTVYVGGGVTYVGGCYASVGGLLRNNFADFSENIPPAANDDPYTTAQDTTLSVPAPGVLSNDLDEESDPLTSIAVTGPANGILEMGVDGTFDYTPNPGFSGTDSFTYRVNDGYDDSNTAAVTITVGPALFNCADTLITGIPQTECEALAALYNSTGGSGWTDSTNWNTASDAATWYGVTVTGGNVTFIDLSKNNLNGTIPVELGNLANLETLYLHENQLSGSIPPELGNLSNLKDFQIDSNQLSGAIPPELGNLSNLETLYVHGNQLNGAIPAELGNLSNLRDFQTGSNQLSGVIPPELGSLSNLETLYLYGNQLSGPIPPELGNLLNLKDFQAGANQLSGVIPAELENLTNLTMLDIGYNALTASDPPLAFLNTKAPDWAATQTIPPENPEVANIASTSATLTWTPIPYTGDGGYYRVLYSETPGGPYTEAGVTGDKSASEFMVTGLTLGITYFFSVESFTPAHGDQQNDLTSSRSGEVSAATIVGQCDCTQTDVTGIPQIECEALVALYDGTNGPEWTVSANWNTASDVSTWEGVTVGDGNVISIVLTENNLNGPIPAELGNLSNLQVLELWKNNLTGPIPVELGNLSALIRLALSHNPLGGTIPAELGNLPNLQDLWLYSCELSGSIPGELGNLTSLYTLKLYENQLTGSIPPELGKLSPLETLQFWQNQLSGTIPAELGNLTNLSDLSLSYNQLEGTIPAELGNLTSLITLRLYGNQLSGVIPAELENLNILSHIDVGYNALSAAEPPLAFLNSINPDWAATQTLPPANLGTAEISSTSVKVTWTPIPYTGDGGYYRVLYSETPGGPYTEAGLTGDKSASEFMVTGLTPGITYYLSVEAFTPAHDLQLNDLTSAQSAEVSASTTPAVQIEEKCPDIDGSGIPFDPALDPLPLVFECSGVCSPENNYNNFSLNVKIKNPVEGDLINIESYSAEAGIYATPNGGILLDGERIGFKESQSDCCIKILFDSAKVNGNTVCALLNAIIFDGDRNSPDQRPREIIVTLGDGTVETIYEMTVNFMNDTSCACRFEEDDTDIWQVTPTPADESIVAEGASVKLAVTPLAGPENVVHKQTHWLIKRWDAPNWNAIHSSDVDLTEYTVTGLKAGLKYVWKAGHENENGEIIWSRDAAFKIGQSSANEQVNVPPGSAGEDFTMISFYRWPDDPTFLNELGGVIGAELDRTQNRFAGFDQSKGCFTEYGCREFRVEPGRAYWVLARAGLALANQGVPVTPDDDFELALQYNPYDQEGWNMIGSPNGIEYYWGNILVVVYEDGSSQRDLPHAADPGGTLTIPQKKIVFGPTPISEVSDSDNVIDRRLWRMEGGAFVPENVQYQLKKNSGYMVKVKRRGVSLIFPARTGGTPGTPDSEEPPAPADEITGADDEEKPSLYFPTAEETSPPLIDSGEPGGCFIQTAVGKPVRISRPVRFRMNPATGASEQTATFGAVK